MQENLKNKYSGDIPDDEFRDMFADFGILCLAVIAFFIALLTFPFALSVLC